ncbi:MAG: thioesterase family protein [Solirubrobacterales bacterium]
MESAVPDPSEQIDFTTASAVGGGERHYTAEVHPSWDGPLTTHGGLLQAIALRAVDAELGAPDVFQARSITCHYLRPPQHGRIDVFVDPLRRGRRFASTRATISQGGKPCIAALITHSVREMAEVTHWSLPAPVVAPAPDRDAVKVEPHELEAAGENAWLAMPEGAPRFFNQTLLAPRFGHGPFLGPEVDPAVGTENGGWILTPKPQPVDPAWLTLIVDALWPSVLQPLRTPTMAPTLDLTTHIRADIPPEGLPDQPLLVHNVSRAVGNGLADSDSFVFATDGTLLAQGRQLQLVQPLEV